MRKWLHNSILENPKLLIFEKNNAQMASQQLPGESKTINISIKQMCKWLHNSPLENPKPLIFKQNNLQMASQQPPENPKP